MPNLIYVSTPIYYVNGHPHIGHAYTTFVADFLVRFYRMQGKKVIFSTGTDEHGQKVATEAQKQNREVQEFVNEISSQFGVLWKELDLSTYRFVRTSDSLHKIFVQLVLQYLYKKGDIVKGEYEGWYCLPCETFFPETQLVDKRCPDCSREVQSIRENCYFFKMSKYLKQVKEFFLKGSHLSPHYRNKEVLNWIQMQPHMDLCISRPKKRLTWGVPFPFDHDHVVYVWFDALLNYLSIRCQTQELKKLFSEDISRFSEDEASKWLDKILDSEVKETTVIHLIGKDILRPHAMYWPSMLLSLNFPLPNQIFAHGWWTVKGEKMSKSLHNVVEPRTIIKELGSNAFRYFLLRETRLGEDGVFKKESVILRYHSELANDVGNLFSRSLAMLKKYTNSILPAYEMGFFKKDEEEAFEHFQKALSSNFIQGDILHTYIESFLAISRLGNRFIEEQTPWQLFKENKKQQLNQTLSFLFSLLHAVTILSEPLIPQSASRMRKALNVNCDSVTKISSWEDLILKQGNSVESKLLLFPKKEVDCD